MNPSFLTRLRAEWAPSIPRELLAGPWPRLRSFLRSSLSASWPGGSFSGLFASFVISLVIAFTAGGPPWCRPRRARCAGGRAAVQSHGLGYLLAAGLLAGAVQVAFGLMKLGVLMRFVSSSVRRGL